MQEQKLINRKKKANREGNKTLLVSTCIDLAELYVNEGRYDEAIDEYQIVAGVYQQMGEQLDYARANRMIGEAYTHIRKYDSALRHQQIHLDVARKVQDKLEEQRALATIGHTHLTRYLDTSTSDNSDKTPLNLAYKSFMKSLVVCESLTDVNKHDHKDMTARLLANLGVVQECQGNYAKSVELLVKSINLCKSHELFEQLERGYTFLGSLYVRMHEFDKAINQYNLAVEVAERLHNKVQLMCASLSAKADILIKLADFNGAKIALIKAYKLKNPLVNEQQSVEQTLKVVAAMCNAEQALLITADSDHKSKKHNYEKLGDGACHLKNYTKAIEYYQKMLEAAVRNDESGHELSPCYISLAETYRDDKQFDLAIEYFKHDHNVSIPNTKDSITTLLNIADCMEAASKDVDETETIYEQARNECKPAGLKPLEFKVLSRHVGLLKKNQRISQAAQLEIELGKMDCVDTESDGEPSQEQSTPNIGDDISITDLIDLSDDSDGDKGAAGRTMRKRTKGLVIKRNNKGETQLHTACLKGNIELVRRLLEQGHLVNVRDHCGWLPIHEACICGYVEIVQMLIVKGASINDRGGAQCNGMTPLHDAASNGHLQVMQLLLDEGASAIAKNNMGEMPLHVLKQWRSLNELDPSDQTLYDNIIKQLTETAEKSGHGNDTVTEVKENTALVNESSRPIIRPQRRASTVEDKPKKVAASPKIGTLRRNISFDKDLDASTSSSNDCVVDARDEYKRVMENMRHPLRDESVERKRKSNENKQRSAYMQPDEVGDNWLDDDLAEIQQKKRKTNTTDPYINTLGIRSGSARSISGLSTGSSSKSTNGELDDIFGHEFDEFSKSSNKKSKSQSSLIDQGFTRHRSFSPTNSIISNHSQAAKRKHQTKLTHFGHNRSPVKMHMDNSYMSGSYNVFNEPTLSVDVRIDGKLYRVPVLASEMHTRSIKWLADEATKRYSRKECMKPTLELETKNGAVLAEDDFISILFAAGAAQAEEVVARILKLNLPPLCDRYKEACTNAGIAPNESLAKILQESSTSLNISDRGLRSKNLAPLCRAINRQNNLHHLNLSGNFMQDESVQLLCSSLPSLDSLAVLDLSLNRLTSASLEFMAEMLARPGLILQNLISLNLSYNPLGDECLKYLAILTGYLRLQTLKLTSVDFTSEIFDLISNRNTDLVLDSIVNFDVSYNRLGKRGIMMLLAWLKPEIIEELNVSNNVDQEEGLAKDVTTWLASGSDAKFSLKSLNLSRCHVTDTELFELLRLRSLKDFTTFNLSYNESLTAVTLRRLVQHEPSFVNLDLSGCENILKYFEHGMESTWSFEKLRLIRLSFDCNERLGERNSLVNMWSNEHKESARVVEELRGFLELSVCE